MRTAHISERRPELICTSRRAMSLESGIHQPHPAMCSQAGRSRSHRRHRTQELCFRMVERQAERLRLSLPTTTTPSCSRPEAPVHIPSPSRLSTNSSSPSRITRTAVVQHLHPRQPHRVRPSLLRLPSRGLDTTSGDGLSTDSPTPLVRTTRSRQASRLLQYGRRR